MAKPKLGLGNLSDDEIIALAATIVTAMTGNANFTTPNPTLASITTAKTTAQTKVAAYNSAKAAADTALADRDAAIKALGALLTQEAAYVENVTGGDKVKIESAGMSVRADGSPITMTQVLDLAASEGDDAGSLDLVWKPVKGAKSYEIHINSSDPNVAANWSFKQSASKSSATIEGLTSGAKIWVRVRAVGAKNDTGPFSDPATKTVP